VSPVRSLDPGARQALLHDLTRLAGRLAADLGVEEVHLFGSLARGQQHEGSDIDLLVVWDYPGRIFAAIGEVMSRTELPVEPLVVRRETLARRLREGHPFFTRVVAEAIRLYPAEAPARG
jgi:predicted nucleotidyltransferase